MLPVGFRIIRSRWIDFQTVRTALSWQQTELRMFGKSVPQPRLICWMGDAAYTYSGTRNEPTPMPNVILTLRDQLQALLGIRFNSVLGNLYRHGLDSVSWHADDEPELGPNPTIASLSLGASRRFAIRRNSDRQRWDITLHHGDLLIMSDDSQSGYQHSIPKTTRECGERINLTFRLIQ